MRGLIGRLQCFFTGRHKRGKFLVEELEKGVTWRIYRCPRCKHLTRYKAKAQASDGNNGSPADGSMSFRETV